MDSTFVNDLAVALLAIDHDLPGDEHLSHQIPLSFELEIA